MMVPGSCTSGRWERGVSGVAREVAAGFRRRGKDGSLDATLRAPQPGRHPPADRLPIFPSPLSSFPLDSLTQIVLGAAVGEATLGRKVGNRAMLWGGICGTIPDLDVLSNAVSDPMSALAYHRAFTHSLAFAALAAPILGLAIHRVYGGREGPGAGLWVWPALLAAFYTLLTVGSYLMPIEVFEIPKITAVISLAVAGIFGAVLLARKARRSPAPVKAGWRGWSLLAFLAVVTHPLLDCFTAYGTQIFQPFGAARVAWNTISVADPLYTLPFLALLLWARTRVHEKGPLRAGLNALGLALSSAYLALTVVNYFNVAAVLSHSLAEQGIEASATVHSPTILNNVLWSATARGEKDVYYYSQYSLFDRRRAFQPFTRIEGRHDLIAPYREDRDVRILLWFTKGFYGVLPGDVPGSVQVNDLRYGLIAEDPADPNSYIFSWRLDTSGRPARVTREFAGPREGVEPAEWLGRLWERVKGE